MRLFLSRLRAWLAGRPGISDDLAEEIQTHLEMAVEDGGPSARTSFGNPASIAERSRDTWGFPSVESLLKDIRYGFRAMRRSPAFSLVVILTFALGVGVNTAIFSVVHTVLLKPLPYPSSERLAWFGERTAKVEGISVTWVNFQNWRNSNHTFEEMAAFQSSERTLTGRGDPVVVRGMLVTHPYFPLLGMRPQLGRLFDSTDDQPGAAPVIVLNHRFWTNQLGSDPNIVGATLTLSGSPYEVAGVAAPLWEPWNADYYLPLGLANGATTDRRQHGSIRMLGRLKPGVTLAAARVDLDSVMRHLGEVDPGSETEHRSYGTLFTEYTFGDVRGTLMVLMGAAVLILLIACANVASLLLARNNARAGELAVRKAIGAGQMRLVRQLLTETAVIAATGGLAGILVARIALRLLLSIAPTEIPRLVDTRVDMTVLLVACGLTLAAGLLVGLAPVLIAGRIDLAGALKEGFRTGGGRQRQAFRNVLVVAQVALTFVLAFGSGLLLRSLIAAQKSNPGFDPQGVISFSLQLPAASYKTPEVVSGFYAGLLTDLRRIQGVTGASTVSCPPGAGDCGDWFYSIPGRPVPSRNEMPISLFNRTEPGYFQMMRIPVRQGREFQDSDLASASQLAIVNETFARRWWPAESAVGHQIKVGGPYEAGDLLQIVGVTADLRQSGLDAAPMSEIFRPSFFQPARGRTVLVRAAGNAPALMSSIRRVVGTHDANLPLQRLGMLEESLGAGLARRRFSTLLLTMFAALAMALAAVGIYGLLSYWVTCRESEIAIRLALGARPAMILRWASFHALRLAVIGVALGLAGGWIAARGLEDLVFGIPSRNPATMLLAALAVLAIALAASAIPATRAARIDAAKRLHSS
jgi:putative ABC transport system permease protein